MRNNNIKNTSLLLTNLPVVFLTLILAGIFLRSYFNTLDDQLIIFSKDLSLEIRQELSSVMANNQLAEIDKLSKSKINLPDVRAIAIYNANMELISHVGPDMKAAKSLSFLDSGFLKDEDLVASTDSFRIISPIYHEDHRDKLHKLEKTGQVEIEISTLGITIKKYQITLLVFILLLISWMFQGSITYYFINRTQRALEILTKAMRKVEKGEFESQLDKKELNSFKNLQASFNNMIKSLDQSQKEFQETIDQANSDVKETLDTIEVQNIELNIARKEALEASRIKSEFLANMSHEIRTPLNSIIGFTNLLLKTPVTSRQKDHLETIKNSSNSLLFIINEVLDFSKIEAGKLILEEAPFNLRKIADETLELLSPAANEKNIEQVLFLYSDIPNYLIGDSQRIKQVLTNLISNAIKFSSDGTIVIRINLESESGTSIILRFSVSDNGPGLTKEQQKDLFKAFSQSSNNHFKKGSGTGLGLVISKHLAEKMGGEVGFESEVNQGSTFWFTSKLKIDSTKNNLKYPKQLHDQKIALFDDNKSNALVISHTLEKEHCTFTNYSSIDALYLGVKQAAENKSGYDFAMIGINRNYENNNQLIAALNEIENEFHCKTIILSNLMEGSPYQNELEKHCSYYLEKPFTHKKFFNCFSYLLDKHNNQPLDHHVYNTEPIKQQTNISSNLKILAVDDNPSNLKLICSFLQDLGVNAISSDSGEKAVEEASKTNFDLIFMDVRMPEINGIEATKRIRKLESEKKHVPIIAVTAHAMANEKIKLLSSGMDDYITKPINETQLRFIINKWTTSKLEDESIPSADSLPDSNQDTNNINSEYVILDIEESIRLAGGKHDLAKDIYLEFIESLPNDRSLIQESQNNSDLLLERVHKLHGGTRYCGVPNLRNAVSTLETKIKNGETEEIVLALKNLNATIDQLLDWDKENKAQILSKLSTNNSAKVNH